MVVRINIRLNVATFLFTFFAKYFIFHYLVESFLIMSVLATYVVIMQFKNEILLARIK